jgi:hypothetical protein
MSVSFYPANQSYVEGCQFDHTAVDHEVFGMCIEPTQPEVNVSNANARELLDMLGVDPGELVGRFDATELHNKCALAMLDPDLYDEGRPSVESQGAGGARIIDVGRRPGYWADLLARLQQVADAAMADEVDVYYC